MRRRASRCSGLGVGGNVKELHTAGWDPDAVPAWGIGEGGLCAVRGEPVVRATRGADYKLPVVGDKRRLSKEGDWSMEGEG